MKKFEGVRNALAKKKPHELITCSVYQIDRIIREYDRLAEQVEELKKERTQREGDGE